jgi:hypothetical protein
MDTSYIKAVEQKLKKKGLSDEEIAVEIKRIMNPNIMEDDKIETPIVEEEVVVEEEVPVVEEEEEITEETPVLEEEVDKVEEEE